MSTKINPVTPKDLEENLVVAFPDFVIQGINNAIKNVYRGQSSFTIKQKDIIQEILAEAPVGVSTGKLFDLKYLDFEKLYSKFGWNISYSSPDSDESFDQYFTFKAK